MQIYPLKLFLSKIVNILSRYNLRTGKIYKKIFCHFVLIIIMSEICKNEEVGGGHFCNVADSV